jgi:outer membrane protein TolC
MIKRIGAAITAGLIFAFAGQGQTPLTLEQCYNLAERNYPLQAQNGIFPESSALKVKNLNKNYLPQINVNGSVSYQSDVTQVSIELPKGLPELAMPSLSKDWYKLTLDVNQSIYDGNVTRYQKQVEEYNLQADQKGVEVELYKLRERVNQFYFGILLIDQNERLMKSNAERIEAKIREVHSAIVNGAMLEMNLDLLKAELIRIEQSIREMRHDRTTYCRMLAELTATKISDDAILQIPDVTPAPEMYENLRPENQLFAIQRARLDVMKNMVTTKWNPKLFAFGQAGYGRPGLNMLDDSFRPWYVIGAKVTWNPWNWNANKNEKQILSLQSEILRSQQETFDRNLRISAQKELGDIARIADLLAQDQEIINLRSKITRAASSQLDNGVITSSDYIARMNEETQAKLNLEVHKLQLVKARVGYLYTVGKKTMN